jgi:sugar lactone lactonase YvrE
VLALASKRASVCLLVTLVGLAGCAGNSNPSPTMPNSMARTLKSANTLCPCLYVANSTGNSVTVYASSASGNAKPIQEISGSKTKLLTPFGVAVDGSGNIYVTNDGVNQIDVYAAGATGNVAPIRGIVGQPYRYPKGIAIDPVNGDIYVAKPLGNSIIIYAPSASGKDAPIASIEGSNTGLNAPNGVSLDTRGNIYVTNKGDSANTGNDSVTVYAAGSTGNVAPTQTIAGTRTGLDIPVELAVDPSEKIYVANITYPNSGSGSLTVYAAGANGNVAPTETIEGAKTKLNLPAGIAVDSSDNIYAANFARTDSIASSVTVYAAGTNGNVAPIKTISGAQTDLDGPRGIVIH